ncbi:unnamed protein product, partial [marine sediment metagenome]
ETCSVIKPAAPAEKPFQTVYEYPDRDLTLIYSAT